MSSRPAVVVIALLFATAGLAAEPNVGGFKLYSMPAYSLVTNDERSARLAISAAAKAEATMETLLPHSEYPRNEPTVVLIVPNVLWTRYLSPGKGFYGNFFPGRFANYLTVDYITQVEPTIAREYCHLYLHTKFEGVVPVWFDEGVARYVWSFEVHRDAAGFVEQWPYPSDIPGGEPRIPLKTLLELDRTSRSYLDSDRRGAIGLESRSIVQLGLVTDRQHFGQNLLAFVAAQGDLQPLESALRSSFDMSLQEFEDFLMPYRGSDLVRGKTSLAVPPLPALPAGQLMKRLDALELIAGIMFESGLNADHLPEVVAAMEHESPGSSTATAWRMRLAARTDDVVTLQSLAAKLGTASNDPVIIRGAGLAMFDEVQRAKQDRNSVVALDLLDRAIMSRPDDVEAIWAYATLASQMKRDLPVALRRIRSARAILPLNPDLAQAMALVYEAMDDRPHMRQATEEALRFSKTPAMTRWAKSLLESNPAKN
jgi:hypothetical protein